MLSENPLWIAAGGDRLPAGFQQWLAAPFLMKDVVLFATLVYDETGCTEGLTFHHT
jgi:hypothetical protein